MFGIFERIKENIFNRAMRLMGYSKTNPELEALLHAWVFSGSIEPLGFFQTLPDKEPE